MFKEAVETSPRLVVGGEEGGDFPKISISRRAFLENMGYLFASSLFYPPEEKESNYRRYGINYGALEPLVITPGDPRWAASYREHVGKVIEIARKSPTFFGFIEGAVAYFHSVYESYYNPNMVTSDLVRERRPAEVMERIKRGIMTCGEISLLAQYALKAGNGVVTTFNVISWISEAFNGAFMVHTNLTALMKKPEDNSRRSWILEFTNGTIMEREEYIRYLNSVFRFSKGIYSWETVSTGL